MLRIISHAKHHLCCPEHFWLWLENRQSLQVKLPKKSLGYPFTGSLSLVVYCLLVLKIRFNLCKKNSLTTNTSELITTPYAINKEVIFNPGISNLTEMGSRVIYHGYVIWANFMAHVFFFSRRLPGCDEEWNIVWARAQQGNASYRLILWRPLNQCNYSSTTSFLLPLLISFHTYSKNDGNSYTLLLLEKQALGEEPYLGCIGQSVLSFSLYMNWKNIVWSRSFRRNLRAERKTTMRLVLQRLVPPKSLHNNFMRFSAPHGLVNTSQYSL